MRFRAVKRSGPALIEYRPARGRPDLTGVEDALAYMNTLKNLLEYTEVSDCKMQEGRLRFEVNISVREKGSLKVAGELQAHALDALDIEATKALIAKTQSQMVINVGSAFINMSVLQACIETGAAYLDTAIHEEQDKICETPPWYANYEWKRRELCAENKVTAILGVGFDPGVAVQARNARARRSDRQSLPPALRHTRSKGLLAIRSPITWSVAMACWKATARAVPCTSPVSAARAASTAPGVWA